ncbi:hypothetical protein GB937_010726 [Aspergillus fischeri]|nr:hypothetical protein GB937_010726 [Aspergillus fischeri]
MSPSEQNIEDLWTDAVIKYNSDEDDPKQCTIQEKQDIEYEWITAFNKATESKGLLSSFSRRRHSETAVDQVRKSFLSVINAVSNAVEPIGSLAACAYPPASAISQAILFVFQACQKVSQNLDQIATFYKTMQIFFERLSLLEERLPQEKAFGMQLTRVFCALLDMCSEAKKYVKQGRAIAFLRAVVGKDDGLAGAYSTFTDHMNDLESSVIHATLGTVTETSRHLKNMEERFMGVLSRIDIRAALVLDHAAVGFQKRAETIQSGESRSGMLATRTMDRNTGTRPLDSFEYVLKWLWTPAEIPLGQWKQQAERSLIEEICAWVDPQLIQLIKETDADPLPVHISGRPGTGKSMLAFYIFRFLQNNMKISPSPKFVVYFNFCTETGRTCSLEEMLCSCALQVAEKDLTFRKALIRIINQGCEKCNKGARCPCKHWVPKFATALEKQTLFVVLDGLDHMGKEDLQAAQNFLTQKRENIGLILVAQNNSPEQTRQSQRDIVIPEQHLKEGLEKFADVRLLDLPRFSRYTNRRREYIARLASEKAENLDNGFLYVHLMLHHLNETKGRLTINETVFPRHTDDVYKMIFVEAIDGRSTADRDQLHSLLTWLAWTKDQLTLGAAEQLLEVAREWLKPKDGSSIISIEAEVYSRYSRILVLSANPNPRTELTDGFAEDEDHDDGSCSLLRFSAPSLRTYYQAHSDGLYKKGELFQKYDSRQLMFKLMKKILERKGGGTRAEKELISLAAKGWLRHSRLIWEDSATDQAQIEKDIRDIFTEKCDVLRRLERTVDITKPNPSVFTIKDLQQLQELLFTDNSISSLWRTIARIHVNNWWRAKTPIEAYTSFRLAHQALLESKEQEILKLKSRTSRKKMMVEVSKFFDKEWEQKLDSLSRAKRFRKRSMALRYDGHYQEAIDDIKSGIEQCKTADEKHSRQEFKLLDRKGRTYFGWSEDVEDSKGEGGKREPGSKHLEKAEKAVVSFKEALENSDVMKKKDNGQTDPLNMTYQLKAKAEALLCRWEECLESVQNATGVKRADGANEGNKEPQILIYFDDIVLAMANNGAAGRIIALLERVHSNQLAVGCTDRTHALLQCAARSACAGRAAKKEGPLEKMYGAIKTRKENNPLLPLNPIIGWYGALARHFLEDPEKAKEYLEMALTPDVETEIKAVIPASCQLADMLLKEFWNVPDTSNASEILSLRQAVCSKMDRLVEIVAAQVPESQSKLSQARIPLAMMHGALRSVVTFKKETDVIFRTCCAALEDHIASNDPPSFRMLAKVLALFCDFSRRPKLKESASIACACQFYIMDEEVVKAEEAQAETSTGSRAKKPKDLRNASHRSRSSKSSDTSNEAAGNNPLWSVECSGGCLTIIHANNLETEQAFLCYYCTNTILCKACYRDHKKSHDGCKICEENCKNAKDAELKMCYKLCIPCQPYHRHIQAVQAVQAAPNGFMKFKKNNIDNKGSTDRFKKGLKDWLKDLQTTWEEEWKAFLKDCTWQTSRNQSQASRNQDARAAAQARGTRRPAPRSTALG